jgi:methionine-rich copper-binding protein CopC
MNRLRYLAPILTLLLAVFTGPVPAAYAQSHLVKAAPGLDATINLPPTEVRLVFDHPLLAEGTSLHVSDKGGARVEKSNGHIDPADAFALVVSLPVLFEGQYTVSYTAATVGSSTVLADTYTFTLDLPNPILNLSIPGNGEAFAPGPVPVRLETRFVDFNVYESRVRLYVDGHLYREWTGLRASVDGLQPGVHEIRTVLVQVNQEVPETSTTVYIAIKRPDMTAASAPDGAFDIPSLQTSVSYWSLAQLVELAVVVVILLGAGIWLGRGTAP